MKTTRTVTHRHRDHRDITIIDPDGGRHIGSDSEQAVLDAAAAYFASGAEFYMADPVRCNVTGVLVGVNPVEQIYGTTLEDCVGHHWVFESQLIERFEEDC